MFKNILSEIKKIQKDYQLIIDRKEIKKKDNMINYKELECMSNKDNLIYRSPSRGYEQESSLANPYYPEGEAEVSEVE